MEKVWEIEDPDEQIGRRKTRRIEQEAPPSEKRDPAVAYTLSRFCWGAGQLYSRQTGKGLLFFFFMLMVYGAAVLSFVYQHSLFLFLRARHIPFAEVFLAAMLLFFFTLLFWTYNASDAYHKAMKARTTSFRGVKSRVYPFLCSLLVPGWGQFLNGQPLKGALFAGFSVLGLFSLASVPAVLLAWQSLEISDARFIVESIFAIALLFLPLVPLIWVLGCFDALKVSFDDIKKEPILDRLKYANNRRRTQGWVRGIFPHLKLTLVLGLLLGLLVVVADYSFPKNFYHEQLTNTQARLRGQGMTIVPDLINRLQSVMKRAGM